MAEEVAMTIILNLQEDLHYTYLFFSVYKTEPDLSLSITCVLRILFCEEDFFLIITCQQKKNITGQ